jgi:hypothetical protein
MSSEADEKKESMGGKTVPQIAMARTMTVSRRPWSLILVFFLSLCFVAVFAVIQRTIKTTTPSGTFEKLIAAFKRGDVEMLLGDRELNFKERALSDIRKRGLEEYNKVGSAFEVCIAEGLKKYQTLKTDVTTKGEEAFKDLPSEQQRYIRGLSKNLWMYTKGMDAVPEAGQAGITAPAVFIDQGKAVPYILKLGRAALAAQGEKNLPDIASLEKKKYPKGAPPKSSVHAKILDEGAKAFEELKKKVAAAGMKAFSALPKEERDLIDKESKMRFIVEHGMEGLTPEDRDLITGPQMFFDSVDAKQEAARLCLPYISESQVELISGKNYTEFTTQKNVYIMKAGREKYEKFLKALFRGCNYKIKETRAVGEDEFDLVRASKVALEIEWSECSGVETFIPSTFLFELEEGKWWIVMPSEEPVQAQETEAKGEEKKPEPEFKDRFGAMETKEAKP